MCGQGGSWGCESCSGDTRQTSSILLVGATETLGWQIVRRAVDEGNVRCLVRPRPTPVDFLRDWRATVVNVDWEGKVALIQCAKAMGIQNLFSIPSTTVTSIPKFHLWRSSIALKSFSRIHARNYWTVCSIAVPILEEKSVWGTDAPTRIAYMDTQLNHALTVSLDVAPLTFVGLRNEKVNGKLLTFAGPCAWTTQEVITLCERFAGLEANITKSPSFRLESNPSANKAF